MPDVVEQRGVGDQFDALPCLRREVFLITKVPEGRPGKMVHAYRVIETRVRGTGIDQVSQTQLLDVSEALEGRGVHDSNRGGIEADRFP